MSDKTFKEWHAELTELARKHKVGWLIPKLENYPTDAYDDGLSPSEELAEQFSAAVE